MWNKKVLTSDQIQSIERIEMDRISVHELNARRGRRPTAALQDPASTRSIHLEKTVCHDALGNAHKNWFASVGMLYRFFLAVWHLLRIAEDFLNGWCTFTTPASVAELDGGWKVCQYEWASRDDDYVISFKPAHQQMLRGAVPQMFLSRA